MTLLAPSRNFIDFNRIRRPSDRLDRMRVAPHPSAIAVVEQLGLLSGLQLCLDAGDRHSYTSGQSWLDRSIGRHDFFLGADGSATSTDPTFNGTAGQLSSGEYFSGDGGDLFTYDTTNETWINNLHKDNALWGMAGIYYPADFSTSNQGLWGTRATGAATVGVGPIFTVTGGLIQLQVANGSGSLALSQNGSAATAAAWNFIGISLNEAGGAGASFIQVNGTVTTFNGAYSSPSASDATHTLQFMSTGNSALIMRNGGRLACVVFWEGFAPSQAQMAAVYNALRGRFGI